jgi:chromosome segregation ATPase
MFDEGVDDTPTGGAKASYPAQQRQQPTSNQEEEVRRLRAELEERDRQLDKQTADLEEMQSSVAELQMVTPKHNSAGTMRSRGSGIDELDASQLRALVREKNEKIAGLTSDFDTHRAQFRNTIDSLERTSDETNRIYEHKVEELTQQIRDLQDRGDDVESVAQQLKQLEELVQELEEGLEDARRGEAEARGEVEFLRGEVERTRSELRREREKAAAALKGAGATMEGSFSPGGSSREVEQRDDEIRGLKAIIHSLSRDAVPDVGSPKHGSRRVSKQRQSGISQTNGHTDTQLIEERQTREKLEREIKELEGLVDRKTYREEELEQEIMRLRKLNGHVSIGSNGFSEKTTLPNNGNHQPSLSKTLSNDWRDPNPQEINQRGGHVDSMIESDTHSTTMTDTSSLYCEMCETFGHEIFTCPNINGDSTLQQQDHRSDSSHRTGRDVVAEGLKLSANTNDYPPPLSPARSPQTKSPAATPKAMLPNPMETGPVAGKKSGVVDMERWCALCERDGHESVDCPFEDMY